MRHVRREDLHCYAAPQPAIARAIDFPHSSSADQLHDLQKRLLDGVKSKRVDADFARQVLAGIDTVAGAYGLELPPLREQDGKDKNK